MMTRVKRKRFAVRKVAAVARKAPAVERRVVTLSYPGGPRDVDAHVVGPLAVHRDARGQGWCVTHVRTGMTVVGATARATFRQAMRVAREAGVSANWEFGQFGRNPRFPSVVSVEKLRIARLAVHTAGVRAGLTLKRKEEGVA